MTRRTSNPDGTISLKSFSYFGPHDGADEALRREIEEIGRFNRKASAEWEQLAPEEQSKRRLEFELSTQRSLGTQTRRNSTSIDFSSSSDDIPSFI